MTGRTDRTWARLLPSLVVCLLTACSIDHGIRPQLGLPTITGTVVFKGQPPENTDWVLVVASRDFPPTDVVELSLAQSDHLPTDADSAEYRIELPGFGRYAAVAAIWKAVDEPLVFSDVLGIYGVSLSGGIFLPDSVDVTADSPVAEGIDLVADYAAVNRGAVLSGTITYAGPWPGNTELIGVAAYENRPVNLIDFFSVASLNISLPLHVDAHDYRLAVPPGTYRYVVVLWKARGTSIFAFRELGFFAVQPGSGMPGEVTVAQGDTARSVDIQVDFARVD